MTTVTVNSEDTPVELELGYDPAFQTPRFDVFLVTIVRNPELGFCRDVYTAWFRDEDVPRSVCEVTLFGNYVEWLHVCEQHRRSGIATEVLQALEQHLGVLSFEGATEAGDKFVEAYNAKYTGAETVEDA
jgi:GNAT superfamily N-acetyltransferase